jgi:hypothetical protein
VLLLCYGGGIGWRSDVEMLLVSPQPQQQFAVVLEIVTCMLKRGRCGKFYGK